MSVVAEEEIYGYDYENYGTNNSSYNGSFANQYQGNQSNQDPLGGSAGQQQGGQHQNGSQNQNQQGSGNQSSTSGHQYRYQYRAYGVSLDGDSNQTRIRSQYRKNLTEESFEVLLTTDDALLFSLSFIPNLNATANQPHFQLLIEKIIEYQDLNTNGRYDKNDLTVSSVSLSDLDFTDISYSNTTTPEGSVMYTIETHSSDKLFALIIYVVSNETSLNNNFLTPQEIKFDFIISEYPFTNQTTQLALVTRMTTRHQYMIQEKTSNGNQVSPVNERELNVSSQDHSGFYSWVKMVNVDNDTYPVNVTIFSETAINSTSDEEPVSQTEIIFSYPQGEKIVHDPKIGVNLLGIVLPPIFPDGELSLSELLTMISLYLGGCGVAAILFIGVVSIRKKR